MINPALEAGVHQTSSFTAEPDEPATRVLCTVEREEPTLSGRVGRETEGNSTGEKSGQAGLASAHRQTGSGSPRRSHSAKMQKRGVPPAGASGSPPLSPQLRRTRARRAHPPHTSARLRGSPRPEDPRAAAPTYPATRTAHRGPRTAAASCRTWSPTGLLPSASGGRKGPRRVRIPNFLGATRGVAAAPSDCASETEGSDPGRMGQAALRRRRAADQDLDSLQRPPHGDSGPAAAALSPPAPAPSAPARRGRTLSAARCPLQQAGLRTRALRMRTRGGVGERGRNAAPAPPARLEPVRAPAGCRSADTSGRSQRKQQPIGVSDLRPPTCGARLESGSRLMGRGESQGLGALSFSISP